MEDKFSRGKGVSLIALVFVVLAVILGAIAWYQYNILGGVGVTKEAVELSRQEKTNYEFKNSVSFLSEALGDSATNASQTVSSLGGRNGTEEKYRYWRCDTAWVDNSGRNVIMQVPSVERVRFSLQNKSMRYLNNWTMDLYGIRDNVIYRPGELLCVEPGYDVPLSIPENDNFRVGGIYEGLNITYENYKRVENNLTVSDQVNYNRLWYLYAIMRRWTEDTVSDRKMQKDVKSEVAKVKDEFPPQKFCMEVCACPCPYRPGCTKIPNQWIELLKRRVKNVISDHVDVLETDDRYFGNKEVRCAYDIRQRWYENKPIPKKSCSRVDCDGDDEKEWLVKCGLVYKYKVEVDIDITCYDTMFRSITRKKLENLDWNIRFNLEVEDPPNDGMFIDISDLVDSPGAEGEKEFPVCRIGEENPNPCNTSVETVREMSEDEKEGLY